MTKQRQTINDFHQCPSIVVFLLKPHPSDNIFHPAFKLLTIFISIIMSSQVQSSLATLKVCSACGHHLQGLAHSGWYRESPFGSDRTDHHSCGKLNILPYFPIASSKIWAGIDCPGV
jgi:hypothetical protein